MNHDGNQFDKPISDEERAKNRAEQIKFEKMMRKEEERGIENWPPLGRD